MSHQRTKTKGAAMNRGRETMRPFTGWIVVFDSGVSWGMPRKTRAEAIDEYTADSLVVAGLDPSAENVRAEWNRARRAGDVECIRVDISEAPSR